LEDRKDKWMKTMKFSVLAAALFFATANLCHATYAVALTTYVFEADPGQPTLFNGSTITLGVPSVNLPDIVFSFDIIDPNALGGQVTSGLDPLSVNINSVLPTGWTSSFQIDYTKVGGGSGVITVIGNGATGSIEDDPVKGTWTAVTAPDRASTLLLLGLTLGVLGAMQGKRLGFACPESGS
jgi:hypothetical protein